MKKCDYCAKEISYHEMYCCDECQNRTFAFYDLRDKYQKFFAVINGVGVLGIGVFLFVFSLFQNVGLFGMGGCLTILGVMYYFLPFPPDVMIQKYKLKKSIFITRIIAGVIFLLGIIVLICAVLRVM